MYIYHKIALNDILIQKDIFALSNSELSSISDIPYLLTEQSLSSQNTSQLMNNIILEIMNPQLIHDGNIKITCIDNNLSIDSGEEKIISACYHQEKYIIVYSEDDITAYFKDIQSYQSLSQINFSFTQYPLSEDIMNTSINYNDVFDIDYAQLIMNKDNLDYSDKQMIIKEVKSGNYGVVEKMPSTLFKDDDFIIELLHLQKYILNDWFSLNESRRIIIAEKLYDKQSETTDNLLAYILTGFWKKYIHYFYENVDDDDKYEITPPKEIAHFIHNNFFNNIKLVKFILTNNYFESYYAYNIQDIVSLIPKGPIKDQLKEEIISKLSIKDFYLIPNIAFSDNNCLAKIFSRVITNLDYNKIPLIFSKKHEITYSHWADNKENLLDILSKTSKVPVVYTTPVMTIYDLVSPSLKKDKDVVLAFVRVSPNIVKVLPKKLKNDNDVIKMYVTNINQLSFQISNEYEIEKLFIVEDEITIKKICSCKPEVMLHDKVPDAWKKNIELYHLNMEFTAINFNKYPQYIKDAIINNQKVFNKYMDKHPILYESLPLVIQLNKQYALKYVNRYDKAKLPQTLLLNKDFCADMVLQQPQDIRFVPEVIRNNTYFILKVFKNIYDTGLYKSLTTNNFETSYKDIFTLLTFFNIDHKDSYKFLVEHFKSQENYMLYQSMQNQLPTTNIIRNKRKI